MKTTATNATQINPSNDPFKPGFSISRHQAAMQRANDEAAASYAKRTTNATNEAATHTPTPWGQQKDKQIAALEARIRQLEAALADAAFILERVGANPRDAFSFADSCKRSATDSRAALVSKNDENGGAK